MPLASFAIQTPPNLCHASQGADKGATSTPQSSIVMKEVDAENMRSLSPRFLITRAHLYSDSAKIEQ